jgi:P4 family phage/plasmid primase-like protien
MTALPAPIEIHLADAFTPATREELHAWRDVRYTPGGKVSSFDPARMAHDLCELYDLAVHPQTGELWYEQGGLWRPDNLHPRLVDRYVRAILDNLARTVAVNETRAQLAATSLPRLDANHDPFLVNFQNVAVNATTLDPVEQHPDLHLTTQLPHAYRPDLAHLHPQFDRFLAQVFEGHEDSIPLVWSMIGYCMLPSLPIHQAFWLYGPTSRNGKGTLLRVIEHLIGKHNTSHVPIHQMSPQLDKFMAATMDGKLVNFDNDASGSFIKDTSLFLQLSSGEQPMVQHKGQNPFPLSPTATIIAASNTIPQVRDATPAWFNRWLPIYFPHSFAGHEDIHLASRLLTEVEAIGATAMVYLQELLDQGRFSTTPVVDAARYLFAARADSVRGWFEDHATVEPTERTKLGTLYASYAVWAERANNGKRLTQDQFRDRLSTIPGVEQKVYNGDRGWTVVVQDAPSNTDPASTLESYAAKRVSVAELYAMYQQGETDG